MYIFIYSKFICIFSGIRDDNHLNPQQMWDRAYGCQFYRCLFSEKRFENLLRAMRFDVAATRRHRLQYDRFAHIRVVWDIIIANCRKNYNAGPVVTVDEQLIGFRGACIFRMFIKNKPAKYGLKAFMACDSDSNYCLNAIPYLGKGSMQVAHLEPKRLQGEYFTMSLLEDNLIAPGRVVCCDSWFTSIQLARKLKTKRMHIVGTMQNKNYLPTHAIYDARLELKENMAVYNHAHKVNVLFKRTKAKKHLALMTSIHNRFTIVEHDKCEATMFYNASKGAVDTFDMMCAASSVSRKTLRWPMAIFYGLLNIVMNNSWIIYNSRHANRNTKRYDYTTDLAYHLARPWAQIRHTTRGRYMTVPLRNELFSMFNLPGASAQPLMPEGGIVPQGRNHPQTGRRKLTKDDSRRRCTFCPNRGPGSTWSGKVFCCGHDCQNIPCDNHSVLLCMGCMRTLNIN